MGVLDNGMRCSLNFSMRVFKKSICETVILSWSWITWQPRNHWVSLSYFHPNFVVNFLWTNFLRCSHVEISAVLSTTVGIMKRSLSLARM